MGSNNEGREEGGRKWFPIAREDFPVIWKELKKNFSKGLVLLYIYRNVTNSVFTYLELKEIATGKVQRKNNVHYDSGTGLSKKTIRKSILSLRKRGFIEVACIKGRNGRILYKFSLGKRWKNPHIPPTQKEGGFFKIYLSFFGKWLNLPSRPSKMFSLYLYIKYLMLQKKFSKKESVQVSTQELMGKESLPVLKGIGLSRKYIYSGIRDCIRSRLVQRISSNYYRILLDKGHVIDHVVNNGKSVQVGKNDAPGGKKRRSNTITKNDPSPIEPSTCEVVQNPLLEYIYIEPLIRRIIRRRIRKLNYILGSFEEPRALPKLYKSNFFTTSKETERTEREEKSSMEKSLPNNNSTNRKGDTDMSKADMDGKKEELDKGPRLPLFSKLNPFLLIENEKEVSSSFETKEEKIRPKYCKIKEIDFKLAERLYAIVSSYIKVNKKANLREWANQFRLMREKDGIPLEDIEKALDWYSENIGGEFIPEAFSAKSFREKYVNGKIPAAMKRTSGYYVDREIEMAMKKLGGFGFEHDKG